MKLLVTTLAAVDALKRVAPAVTNQLLRYTSLSG
jgi:hypothetical protein